MTKQGSSRPLFKNRFPSAGVFRKARFFSSTDLYSSFYTGAEYSIIMICAHCGFDDEGLNPFSKCLRCGLPFEMPVGDIPANAKAMLVGS